MSETKTVQPESQSVLPQFTWGEIHEPGAYVELGTGDLYRIPKEALISGASPVVVKESRGGSRLAQVSKNPFCTLLEARLQAASQHRAQFLSRVR